MRIAICDDEAVCIDQVMAAAERYAADRTGRHFEFDAFSDPDDLLEAAEKIGGYDIYLLDIVMPAMNGITLGAKLRDVGYNGKIIYRALEICATLADFEKMLDTLQRPMYVESNYGVIDAQGGAAYYEVNNSGWRKIDVNDPKIAPQGYLVYSNHSYTGRLDEGYGYIRYTNADNVIKPHITRAGEITPQWIFKALSRSFYHSLLGIDLTKENLEWFIDQDFIPRESTSCAMVFTGVKKGEDPMETVMWTVLGYPPVSVAVPLFIKAKEDQPQLMTRRGDRQDPIMAALGVVVRSSIPTDTVRTN